MTGYAVGGIWDALPWHVLGVIALMVVAVTVALVLLYRLERRRWLGD